MSATPFQMNFVNTLEGSGLRVDGGVFSSKGGVFVGLEVDIAGSAVNDSHGLDIPYARLQTLTLFSEQNLTIRTNSSTTPDDTITITANIPKSYDRTHPLGAAMLTADVTDIFVTNTGTEDTFLRVLALISSKAFPI